MELFKLKLSKGRMTLLLFLVLMGYGVYWYFFESSFYVGEPDYSKTQWRTFYGKKTPGYLPEYWTTYFTDAKDPNCQESFNLTFEGEPVARKQYREFIAEEQNDGKTYIIRYPDNYWIGNCEYRSYSGQFYVEEKSDDPRLKQEPYNNKNQYYRFTLIRGRKIADFSLRHDKELEDYDPNNDRMYMNNPKYDVFCFKSFFAFSHPGQKVEQQKSLSCESYEEPKIHKFNLFIFYTQTYWKEHPDIELNLKISKKEYCLDSAKPEWKCKNGVAMLSRDTYNWEIKKAWFDDFYNEQSNSDIP